MLARAMLDNRIFHLELLVPFGTVIQVSCIQSIRGDLIL
jgi:hypothetical protein